jgi:hypothetical protein
MIEDRFIVGIGEGKFNVIAGHKLNDEPLSRAEADRLAHEPVKPAAKAPEAPPLPPKREPAAQSTPESKANGHHHQDTPEAAADPDRCRRRGGDPRSRKAAILLEERAADDTDMSRIAYAAHAHHDPEATRQLDEVTERVIRHKQRLKEVAAALETAKRVGAGASSRGTQG